MTHRGKALIVALAGPTPARAQVSDTMPSFNGTVLPAYAGSTVYLGGDFTAKVVKGKQVARERAAAVDALLPWAPGTEGGLALASSPSRGTIAMGGAFTTVDGRPQKRFAQFS